MPKSSNWSIEELKVVLDSKSIDGAIEEFNQRWPRKHKISAILAKRSHKTQLREEIERLEQKKEAIWPEWLESEDKFISDEYAKLKTLYPTKSNLQISKRIFLKWKSNPERSKRTETALYGRLLNLLKKAAKRAHEYPISNQRIQQIPTPDLETLVWKLISEAQLQTEILKELLGVERSVLRLFEEAKAADASRKQALDIDIAQPAAASDGDGE